ncbi:CPBP family intramembrane glutamic endopeptidase [Phenylobacterium soli]|uniref:CAAX prenyl protease 2/Lysostaphin resistance protein A-like domain-containing protein n=1 Tax=Phenylobacterium soli TaxID=2170551 RepID=A0A328AGK8_9CAUL|nr:type II CAAX endopeptidase family protein [Phenylobacterium soli]RAK53779.1 hypothetical protein DJ017_04175 [Phenylobacterium soli]
MTDATRPEAGPAGAFAGMAGPRERRPGALAATLFLGLLAGGIAALLVGLLVSGLWAGALAALKGMGWVDALALLSDSGRKGRTLGSYTFELALLGSSSIAAALAFLAVAAGLARRRILTFVTAARRFRWSHALLGLAVFLPVVALEIWVEGLSDPAPGIAPILTPGAAFGERLAYAAAALSFLWLAAFGEEALFRGWLLQQTSAFTRRIAIVIAVNAAVFALAHGDLAPAPLVARFAMGAGWAWVVLRLGGVEFTSGAHLANNLGIALLARPIVLTVPEHGPTPWLSLGLQTGSVAVLVVGVEAYLRRRVR